MLFTKLPDRYILVIAEKPRAAQKIAYALGRGREKKISIYGVPVWIVNWMGKYWVIASAAGHLYTLHTDTPGYPVYDFRWVPRYLVDHEAKHTKKFLEVLKLVSRNAELFINACDYDVEGSLIGFLIIKHLGDLKRAKRAKFSSLTPQDIIQAFQKLAPLDYEMVEAGYCRHALDWLWGINVSRALMDIYKYAFGKNRVLSAGRVQTPTLTYAAKITLERKLHIPQPLFYPILRIELQGKLYTLENLDPPFETKHEAKQYIDLLKCNPYAKIVDIEIKFEEIPPPYPFNLPDLQEEAYRIYKIPPYRTQKIAEDLYLEALISYPRTNSQKLPRTLNNREILEGIKQIPRYAKLVDMLLRETRGILRPNNGPKEDPAHPAIHPTGEVPTKKMSIYHWKIYDLIVRRYLATFASPAKIRRAKIVFVAGNRKYALHGLEILDLGWMKYYPFSKPQQNIVPLSMLRKYQLIPLKKIALRISYTPPPAPPTRYSLLKWMESVEIGTESTRAEIIETLYRRGYLVSRKRYSEVSDLGIAIVSVLSKYTPELTSVELTRQFERLLNMIRQRMLQCSTIIDEAIKVLDTYIKRIKMLRQEIASELFKYIEVNDGIDGPRCCICNRKAVDGKFCIFHSEAHKRLLESFKRWKESGYTWREYLVKLVKLRSTGQYVKEVCQYILKHRGFEAIYE